jgi:glycosyltransferase involved in cell wall biosynthesis
MQLGVDKLDYFHTRRFNRITAWVSTLDFLYKQVLERTEFPESRLHMIPLGLDTSRFENQISQKEAREMMDLPQDVKIVGIVGRIDPLKGQDTLIRAMALVEDPNCHAVIVGEITRNHEEYYVIQLKNLRIKNKLMDRVHFRPFTNDVQHAYTAMDFFAMCSAGETFGMVTIEAMASGKGVIGTNTAGTPEILNYGECGEFFEPYDYIELARVINRWLKDPEMVRNYGIHGRERAKKLYAKDVVLDQLENLALSLVAGLPKSS